MPTIASLCILVLWLNMSLAGINGAYVALEMLTRHAIPWISVATAAACVLGAILASMALIRIQ